MTSSWRTLREDPERRDRLEASIGKKLDVPLALLSVLLVLLLVLAATGRLSATGARVAAIASTVLWLVFALEFFAQLLLATRRGTFLRHNWLRALVVVVPVLRIVTALALLGPAALAFLRLASVGGGGSIVGRLLHRRKLLQLGGISAIVVLVAAAGELLLEARAPGSQIRTFGNAVWWSVGTATTVGSNLAPVTVGGRIVAVVMMLYGVGVFTYFMASLASVLVGSDTPITSSSPGDAPRASATEVSARPAGHSSPADAPQDSVLRAADPRPCSDPAPAAVSGDLASPTGADTAVRLTPEEIRLVERLLVRLRDGAA